jgi:hypothetical protein
LKIFKSILIINSFTLQTFAPHVRVGWSEGRVNLKPMFENIPLKEPEDIFSQVEKGGIKPNMPPQAPGVAAAPKMTGGAKVAFFSSYRKLAIWILVIIFGVGILGAAAVFVYSRLAQAPSVLTNVANLNTNTLGQIPETNININATSETNINTNEMVNVAPAEIGSTVDTDDDGLSDAEEATLGTNPNNPDTDNDGLGDREEVKVYKTDPLNPDTDNDSYLDGAEVKSGYNPLGPGSLTPTPNL